MKGIVLMLLLFWIFFPVPQKTGAEENDLSSCLEKTGDRNGDFDGGIQEDLDHLLRDLEKLEKEAEKKMRQDILPNLRKEIERLRKWLREFELRKEKREPDRTWT
jgi:hypothetical protein